ncbi:hypothetical protein L7F22_063857 [Adiantum nelumboides]|nr:hypothetical protein [Adiantum nelumboides]
MLHRVQESLKRLIIKDLNAQRSYGNILRARLTALAHAVGAATAMGCGTGDTVGCGDSFATAIALGYTQKLPIVSMVALANDIGAAMAMGCGAGRNVATLNDVTSILLSSDVCGDCNVLGEVQASS